MKKLTIFIIALATTFLLHSQADTMKVLFLGNSFTFANDLPETFRQLSVKAGKKVQVESNTPGGYTLSGHSQNQTSIQMIYSTNWDYVVLQEQSQIPSWIPERDSLMFPFAIILDSLIHDNHLCTKTLFFMTWAHKNGDLGLPAGLDTYEGMQQRLRSGYMQIADSLDAEVAPCGWAWRHVRQNYPTVELYSSDNYHPANEGTYLAACTFFAMIYGQSPLGINYTSGLNDTLVPLLQHIAGTIVLDSLTLWNKDIYNSNPMANFSITLQSHQLNITNTSTLANSYFWDFGDGTTSTLLNPTHLYSDTGIFNIQLIAQNDCGSDTLSTTIHIISSGIAVNIFSDAQISPNPVIDKLIISGNFTENLGITILSMDGKAIETEIIPENLGKIEIDVSSLQPGVYSIQFSHETNKKIKFIKL